MQKSCHLDNYWVCHNSRRSASRIVFFATTLCSFCTVVVVVDVVVDVDVQLLPSEAVVSGDAGVGKSFWLS